MNDAEQDRQSSSPIPIPSPTAGAGASELTTTSNDPAELRSLLDRARERLTFYESYDRIIGENIRRTGELMLDSIAVREQARAQAGQAERARAEMEAARGAQQALLESLLDGLGTLEAGLDQLRSRISAALAETGPAPVKTPSEVPPDPAPPTEVPSDPSPPPEVLPDPAPPEPPPAVPGMDATTEAMEAGGTPLPEVTDTPTEAPVQIDVIAQGVSRAAIALSLQRFLGELDAVIGVEAREYAEGILRLQVTAKRSLSGADLAEWSDGRGLRVSQEQPRILEIELSPNAA